MVHLFYQIELACISKIIQCAMFFNRTNETSRPGMTDYTRAEFRKNDIFLQGRFFPFKQTKGLKPTHSLNRGLG